MTGFTSREAWVTGAMRMHLVLVLALIASPAARAQEAPPQEVAPAQAAEPSHGLRHLLDVMEVVDTPVFSRNTLQLKYEWTAKPAGASMSELTFKPVFAWGKNREFALRVEVPVETVYPNPSVGPAASGFASLTTTFFWVFHEEQGLRLGAGLELQWNTATIPAVGQPWIIEPVVGIGYRFDRWVGVTLEVNWQKSFGNLGTYLPVNTIQFKPVVSVALPAWFFVSVQDKISWSLENDDVGSLLKFTAGRFLTEHKSVVLAVEYETPLDPVAAQGEIMMVGVLLSYFFAW